MHGHDAGDVVLRQFGQALMDNCRVAVLYAAKEAGRDRYVFSTQKPGSAGGVGQGMRGGME